MKRYLILSSFLAFFSCEKTFFKDQENTISPKANFEYLWQQCDTKYSYFDLKKINWNTVYDKYEPLVTEDISEDSLFNVLGSMLRELKDDHANLFSDLNISFYGAYKKGQDNFDWRIITDHYLPSNYYVSGPFRHDFLNNKEVGYIRFPAFTGAIDNKNLSFILNRYKDTKGLILDLRENGGGAVSDIFKLLSRFIEEKTLTNYSVIKNGSGHNDFSEPEPVYIEPFIGVRYTNRVILLVDRGTYSAGSFTALATKAIPTITLIGDTTGGGLGLPNGGQLPNGWNYRFSITQALTLDKDNSYENGVPPDIVSYFNWNNLTKDEVLEKALEEILN